MQLTLLVPGLLLPETVREDILFDLEAPALSLILGRAQRKVDEGDWLAQAFGLSAPLPAAALRKLGADGTASGFWLCLDPVHWRVARDGVFLADPAQLRLTAAEAAALIDALAPLFAPWGELSASAPMHWELRLTRSLLLETQPLHEAIGRPIDPAWPSGLDGGSWRALLAEAQTLLHAHPVNRQREARGAPLINSLWPWGFGSLPERAETLFTVGWSEDALLAGLCALAGIPHLPPPPRYQQASGHVLCKLDQLLPAAYALDALAWQEGLRALEGEWLAPALAAMRGGECEALRLVATGLFGERQRVTYSLVRGNLWRFWRRPQPLTELFAAP
ncbi:MAG: hypothetical protein N3C63_03270 [Rhodocyclaceae bacterium]|nr:hypothetical protein [Rhodocyclaceae bacterium]